MNGGHNNAPESVPPPEPGSHVTYFRISASSCKKIFMTMPDGKMEQEQAEGAEPKSPLSPLPPPSRSNSTAAGKLSEATRLLFFVAVRSHTLAEQMGLELIDGGKRLKFHSVPRPWLVRHPVHPEELNFDADIFARSVEACSSGERWMRLFILNVWNPGYAKRKGWHFDLFRAFESLDSQNRAAVAWFVNSPVWP